MTGSSSIGQIYAELKIIYITLPLKLLFIYSINRKPNLSYYLNLLLPEVLLRYANGVHFYSNNTRNK